MITIIRMHGHGQPENRIPPAPGTVRTVAEAQKMIRIIITKIMVGEQSCTSKWWTAHCSHAVLLA